MDQAGTAPGPGFRSVLGHRQYLLFLASQNAAMMGYAIYAISIVWLAYTVSHSFVVLGAVVAIEYAAYTASFLFGPIVDRVHDQRTIYLASFPVQAVAVAFLGWSAAQGRLPIDLLFGLVALISLLWDMSWAAANAAPGILLSRDEQFPAAAVAGAVGGALNILGYAIGAGAIVLVGAAGGLYLYAVLLVAASVLAVPLSIRPPPEAKSLRESFRDGWRTVLGGVGRPFLQLASVISIADFATAAPSLLVTLVAVATFAGDPAAYGVLLTVEVVGGVVAGIALGRWNPRARVGLLVGGALVAAGAAFVLASALPAEIAVAGGAWFAAGFASSAYTDAKFVYFRAAVPPEQIGRLFSNMYLFSGVAAALGAVVLGDVAAAGHPIVLGGVIGIVFVAAGAMALVLPAVRRLSY